MIIFSVNVVVNWWCAQLVVSVVNNSFTNSMV